MKALLSTCLILTLFSPAASLTCASCVSVSGKCHKPVPQKCKAGEKYCVSMYIYGALQVSIKACAQSTICRPGNYSSTVAGNNHLPGRLNCCNTDLCNNATLHMPQNTDFAPNGLQCPACYSFGTDHCQALTMANCIGKETQCFSGAIAYNLNTTISPFAQKVALRGCMKPNSCGIAGLAAQLSNNQITISVSKMKCHNAKTLTNGTVGSTALPLPG